MYSQNIRLLFVILSYYIFNYLTFNKYGSINVSTINGNGSATENTPHSTFPDIDAIYSLSAISPLNTFLAEMKISVHKCIHLTSVSKDIFNELWDWGRSFKHKAYIRDSKYRKKFIVQNFIEDLSNDWKILVFGKKYYILCRETRKNDFRRERRKSSLLV